MSKPNLSLHDGDFYAWLTQTAEQVRAGAWTDLDREHLAEELDGMGISQRRELASRLAVLLTHLLKWVHQSARRSVSWENTITTQREDLLDLLQESPSLHPLLPEALPKAYIKARRFAENETGIAKSIFPVHCPFELEQILDPAFWPDSTEK